MLERHLILNAAAAILLATLVWHHPGFRQRWGRIGLVIVAVGALLPVLDSAALHLLTEDRIDLLTAHRYVGGIATTSVLIGVAALLVGVTMSVPTAGRLALGLSAGFILHGILAMLTPVGWTLLAPLSTMRLSLPILPTGHLMLIGTLVILLALAESLPRRKLWFVPPAVVAVGLYTAAGAIQFGVMTYRALPLANDEATVRVYPDDSWLTRWQIVREDPEFYELRRQRITDPGLGEPRVLPRWNDQALFMLLLGDPIVNRFYFDVFRHPVVRLDSSGSQITLLMQELDDQSPLVPGPTLYLESDLTGRKRFYQLQRFN